MEEYGYGGGVWINGYHWYGDPYNLYSDFTTTHNIAPDPLYIYNDGGQSMYLFYNMALAPDPSPTPVPVPEPSSIALLITGLWFIKKYFFKKAY